MCLCEADLSSVSRCVINIFCIRPQKPAPSPLSSSSKSPPRFATRKLLSTEQAEIDDLSGLKMINGVSLEKLNACPKMEPRPKPWCTTCVPYGSFDSDHLDLPTGSLAQARHFHPDWTMETPDDFSVVFSVKGNTDARVYITQFMNETNEDAFEVIFGDFSNSLMKINIWQQGVASYINTAPMYNGQMLSETEYRDFWVNFHEGDLSAGYGRDIFRNIIVSWRVDGLFAASAWQFSKACHYKWDMKYVQL
jgi:hypothetical protein